MRRITNPNGFSPGSLVATPGAALLADRLRPAQAGVEAKTRSRSTESPAQIRSLVEHLLTLPDYRHRLGTCHFVVGIALLRLSF